MKTNNEFSPYLHLSDLMALFGVTEGTVRRWLAEARAGRSRFPRPLDMGRGGKGKLFWTRESIVAFQSTDQATMPPPNVESAALRAKRHNDAIESLMQQGVKLSQPKSQIKTQGGAHE